MSRDHGLVVIIAVWWAECVARCDRKMKKSDEELTKMMKSVNVELAADSCEILFKILFKTSCIHIS